MTSCETIKMTDHVPVAANTFSNPDTVRKTLGELSRAIEGKRMTRNRRASPLDSDWNKMLRLHQDKQRRAEQSASFMVQIIEGLRFDLDILRHAFGRWALRVDRSF